MSSELSNSDQQAALERIAEILKSSNLDGISVNDLLQKRETAQLSALPPAVEEHVVMANTNKLSPTLHYAGSSIPLPKPIDTATGDIIENFNFFQFQWQNYLIASGLCNQSEEVKKSTLLTAIGEPCLKLYTSFYKNLTAADQATEQSLLAAIGRNLKPKLNKRCERLTFNLTVHKSKESIVTYYNRLEKLIKTCEYNDENLIKDILLDKIIATHKDVKMREELWKTPDITLEKALEMCKIKEETEKQLKSIQQQQEQQKQQQNADVKKLPTPPVVSGGAGSGASGAGGGGHAEKKKRNKNNNKQSSGISKDSVGGGGSSGVGGSGGGGSGGGGFGEQKNYPKQFNPMQFNPMQQQQQQQQHQRQQQNIPRMCFSCGLPTEGQQHQLYPNQCPAFGASCNLCSFKNHFTHMCRSNSTKHPFAKQ